MNKIIPTTLVRGSTGKTGSRVAANLINRGLPVRTAARSRADVAFDWSRRESYAPALDGIGRVYLVALTGTPPHTFRNFAHSNANAWKVSQ
ncbi:hypothetical protein ACFSHT_21875 [Paraburkholderia silviterrae]|uniref:NAD(P)-binding protein n=1 Tax=Paraburkholderia silviterrae TaxID=2528715 RepID=A0A4R5MFG4_9BURK|nr:hypothetical protein [Paraburkholderia silviterrae]TDG25952.1 hypothetical protein EYW47_00885 [Paraburkholderia silviterrae]